MGIHAIILLHRAVLQLIPNRSLEKAISFNHGNDMHWGQVESIFFRLIIERRGKPVEKTLVKLYQEIPPRARFPFKRISRSIKGLGKRD